MDVMTTVNAESQERAGGKSMNCRQMRGAGRQGGGCQHARVSFDGSQEGWGEHVADRLPRAYRTAADAQLGSIIPVRTAHSGAGRG